MDSNAEKNCEWIGENEWCLNSRIAGKAYCEKHHRRMYETFLPEMADYILDKESSNGSVNQKFRLTPGVPLL
jgi:hypothetical protein